MWKNFKRWKEKRTGKADISLNTRLVWSLMLLLVAVDAIGLKAEGITLVFRALLSNALSISVIVAMSAIYTYFRRISSIAEMTHMMAVILAFTASGSVCSYLVAALPRPLVDSYLAASDHALGLDWLATYKWVMAHQMIYKMLYVVYSSLVPQLLLLIFILNYRGRSARAWEMMWLFMVSCLICVVLSGIWPAVGAFGYYHVENDRAYVHVFMALHDGTLKIIGDTPIQGIIQFPSFHVALAILLTYAARGMPVLFIFYLELNTLVFLSTPSIGGHHFADLWGGIALAVVSILVVKKVFANILVPETNRPPEAGHLKGI